MDMRCVKHDNSAESSECIPCLKERMAQMVDAIGIAKEALLFGGFHATIHEMDDALGVYDTENPRPRIEPQQANYNKSCNA